MIKKILISFFILAIVGNNFVFCNAEIQKEYLLRYGIIESREFYGKNINRTECITSIIKLIGLRDELVWFAQRATIENNFIDSPYEYNVFIAYAKGSGIALGDLINQKTKEAKFYPDKDVTLKECLLFMVRALHKNRDTYNLDNIIYRAKKCGLIKDTDNFLEKETLSYDNFYLLLNRMFFHRRGYYIDWTWKDGNPYVAIFFDESKELYNNNNIRYVDYYKLYWNNLNEHFKNVDKYKDTMSPLIM